MKAVLVTGCISKSVNQGLVLEGGRVELVCLGDLKTGRALGESGCSSGSLVTSPQSLQRFLSHPASPNTPTGNAFSHFFLGHLRKTRVLIFKCARFVLELTFISTSAGIVSKSSLSFYLTYKIHSFFFLPAQTLNSSPALLGSIRSIRSR